MPGSLHPSIRYLRRISRKLKRRVSLDVARYQLNLSLTSVTAKFVHVRIRQIPLVMAIRVPLAGGRMIVQKSYPNSYTFLGRRRLLLLLLACVGFVGGGGGVGWAGGWGGGGGVGGVGGGWGGGGGGGVGGGGGGVGDRQPRTVASECP